MKAQKNTFSILFIIQKGKLKANGRAPIFARITVNKEMVHFSTRLDIDADRWMPKEGRTIGNTRQERDINSTLEDFKFAIRNRYNEILTRGEQITAAKIKNSLFSVETKSVMFIEHFDRFNEDYRQLVGTETTHKTYTRYVLTRKKLVEFMVEKHSIKDIPITEISLKFIKDFFIYLRTHENNTHNYHMKTIQRVRTVFNEAKNNGWAQADPFANFKIRFEAVDRDYLTKAELTKIMNKKLPSERLERVRDFFVLSCYTGLAYSDIKELKKSEIVLGDDGNQWIDTMRVKTGVQVDVRLLEVPTLILKKYAGETTGDKLLDMPSNQKVNDYLKEIGAMCGIDKNLTFHVARHN